LGPDAWQGEWSRDDHTAWLQAAVFAPSFGSLGIDHIHPHALVLSGMAGIPCSFTAHAKDSAPLRKQLREAALRKVRRDFNLALNVRTLAGYFQAGRPGFAHPIPLP
jgi:hypothetical protein